MLKKKGINGVLYLTIAPKLVPAIPTPKAKRIENIKQYIKKGSLNKVLKTENGETLINVYNVKIIKIKFSIAENTMVGLPISHKKGLNNAVKMAFGATESKLIKLPSNFPIS